MNKKMRDIFKIIIIGICLFFGSCCPARRIATSIHDSIRVEVRTRTEYHRDTIIREIPIISEKITTWDTTSHLENFYAESDARINPDGTLFHALATKPRQELIPIDRPVQYRDSIVYRDKVVKETVHVQKELSWWQKTQIKGFWALIVIIIIIYRKKIITVIRLFI